MTPPHGPPTEAQNNLNETLIKNEAMDKIKTFIDIVKKFFHYKPAEDIEITITKLKAVKEIFELENQQNETEEFDELIHLARENKAISEYLKKDVSEDEDNSTYEDDDLPNYYLGQEGEFVFEL